ncbi:MAG: flagellar protein FlgN [Oscillospiraceae bacterium]|nr:flagellar protein FlgN [Oscillospiraceae bacterium]
MTWTWDAYLRLLRETAATIGQLAQVEREKTAAVSVGNLTEVDECMKREQVFSLRLRGYDIKRAAALKELGLEGVKLSKLAQHAPEELRMEAKQTAEETLRQYDIFKTANRIAQSTLECNLREIEKLMAAQQTAQNPALAPAPAPQQEDGEVPRKKTDFRA